MKPADSPEHCYAVDLCPLSRNGSFPCPLPPGIVAEENSRVGEEAHQQTNLLGLPIDGPAVDGSRFKTSDTHGGLTVLDQIDGLNRCCSDHTALEHPLTIVRLILGDFRSHPLTI